jgi:hypothetical protein
MTAASVGAENAERNFDASATFLHGRKEHPDEYLE